MTTTACPNCGQPLRPGARFCGNCGYSVPAKPPAAAGPSELVPPELSESACPNCGKPVRLGARFCNNCGSTLPLPVMDQSGELSIPPANNEESNVQPQPLSETTASTAPVTRTARRRDDAHEEPRSLVPGSAGAPGAEKPRQATRRSSMTLWLLGVVLVGMCGLAAVAAFVYVGDPFGWFGGASGEATPSPQAIALSTETASPALPETPTSIPAVIPGLTDTPAIFTPPPTSTPLPTPSATVSETLALVPTSTLETLSETQAVSEATPGALVLLEDDFSGDLNLLWLIWGKPRPKTDSGPGDSWLDLAASDGPLAAGVTSKELVPNDPGVMIGFTAQLNNLYPQHMLVVDWDKIPYQRGPESKESGDIHLEIRNNMLILRTPLTRDLCELDWLGVMQHTYLLKIVEGPGVELYVDEQALPLCKMASIGVAPTGGRVSISGAGWVTYVVITRP